MNMLKLGRVPEAVPLLETLVKDPSLGYYSMLAYYRLQSIPKAKLPDGIEQRLGLKRGEANGTPSASSV